MLVHTVLEQRGERERVCVRKNELTHAYLCVYTDENKKKEFFVLAFNALSKDPNTLNIDMLKLVRDICKRKHRVYYLEYPMLPLLLRQTQLALDLPVEDTQRMPVLKDLLMMWSNLVDVVNDSSRNGVSLSLPHAQTMCLSLLSLAHDVEQSCGRGE